MSLLNDRAIGNLLDQARRNRRCTLSEPETKEILRLAGIPTPRETIAHSAEEAVDAAERFGFPVVLKIVSADVPHKSDVGGVRLGLKTPEEVRRAYEEIFGSVGSRCPDARLEGVLVQETVCGTELILGTMTDPQFGPVLMFGLGGVFVEALDDVAFRIIPITNGDAREVIQEIKGAPLLNGYRGSPRISQKSLATILVKLSDLAGRFRDTIREIDINPLIVAGHRSVAVDGLIALHEENRV